MLWGERIILHSPFSIFHLNDAHGTNAEWYDLVCSDVFSKNGQADSLSISLPSGESVFFTPNVNTNAYYFVDVVAQKGPAPIRFNSSHLGRLGSPVVVALAGETNRVPLLIGATYSVTSDVPFTVSCPTNGFAEVSWFDGLNATVRWPMDAHLGALGWLDASGVLFLTNLAADDEEQLRVSADYEMTNIVFSVEQEEVAPGSELFVTANSTGRPGVRYHVDRDWSDPGSQHKNPYGPLHPPRDDSEGE